MSDPIESEVVDRAKALALECEREQRPDHMRSWGDLPEYMRQHWIEKAKRPENSGASALMPRKEP